MIKHIGSQSREPIGEAGLLLIGRLDAETVVLAGSADPTQQEIWALRDDYAGYTVEIEGKGYEFVRDYKPGRDGPMIGE